MGLIDAVKEDLTAAVTRDTSALITAAVWVSLHSANPGSTGLNEITNGTGAQARQLATFSASPGGGVDESNVALTFTVAGGNLAYWYGFWDAETGGDFIGGWPLVGSALLAVASSIDNPSHITCPNHSLVDGTIVRLFTEPSIANSAVPTGYNADTQYTVSVVDADTISLGSSVTGSGAFQVCPDYSYDFVSTGQYVIPLNNLVYRTVS